MEHMSESQAVRAIWDRAHEELVRARARVWWLKYSKAEDHPIPSFFWWPGAFNSRKENWITGDFEVRLRGGKMHCRAYGVEFLREDILEMVGSYGNADPAQEPPRDDARDAVSKPATTAAAEVTKAGRRPDNRWEDVLIEIAVLLHVGDLETDKQSDIEKAMLDYAAKIGFLPSNSSARIRANKLFKLLKQRG
jgi:hypothetical protein